MYNKYVWKFHMLIKMLIKLSITDRKKNCFKCCYSYKHFSLTFFHVIPLSADRDSFVNAIFIYSSFIYSSFSMTNYWVHLFSSLSWISIKGAIVHLAGRDKDNPSQFVSVRRRRCAGLNGVETEAVRKHTLLPGRLQILYMHRGI